MFVCLLEVDLTRRNTFGSRLEVESKQKSTNQPTVSRPRANVGLFQLGAGRDVSVWWNIFEEGYFSIWEGKEYFNCSRKGIHFDLAKGN